MQDPAPNAARGANGKPPNLLTKRPVFFDASFDTGQLADYIALPRVRLHSDRNFFRALPCKRWVFACSEQALEIASLSALLILAPDED